MTNGTLLNETIIKKLIEVKPNIVKISLWASSEEQYKKNYRGVDTKHFIRTIEKINLFSKIKAGGKAKFPKVYLHHVININNFNTINRFVDLVINSNCDGVTFAPFNTLKGKLTSLSISSKEEKFVIKSLLTAKKKLNKNHITHNMDEILWKFKMGEDVWGKVPCYTPWYHVRVRVDGKIQPCGRCDNSIIFGDINKQSFDEIWNSSITESFRKKAITYAGLQDIMKKGCDCNFCCFAFNNGRIHNIFKWFLPFINHKNNKTEAL